MSSVTYAYIFMHLFSFLYIFKELRYVYLILSVFAILFIYLIKSDTYDVLVYTEAVSYSDSFEFGYALLVKFFSLFIESDRIVVFFVQLVLALLGGALALYCSERNKAFAILVFFISVFSVLAINNAIRQGYGAIFLLFSFVFLFEKKYILGFFFIFLAQSFHSSSIVFALTGYFVYFFSSYLGRYLKYYLVYVLLFFVSALSVFLGRFFIEISGYSHYLEMNLSGGEDRTVLWIKTLLIFFVWFLSELLLGLSKASYRGYSLYLAFIRAFIIFLVLFMSIAGGFDEIGSRVLFFYFAVEFLFLVFLLQMRGVYPFVFVVFSYSFAINAWNVLG